MSLTEDIKSSNKIKNDLIIKSYEYYIEKGSDSIINPYEIGEKIGLKVFDDGTSESQNCIKKNQNLLIRIIKELNEDGLICHYLTNLGGIKTTPEGRRYAENKLLPPKKDENPTITFHDNSMKIQTGSDSKIQIQQNSNNSSQVIRTKDDIQKEIKLFIEKFEEQQHNLKLNATDLEEIKIDIDTIKTQAKSPNPKGLKEYFKSIQRILESAAGSAAGQMLIEYIPPIIAMLK